MPRQKTCKACGKRFAPDRPMQSVCSPACGIAFGRIRRMKAEAKEDRRRRQELKTIAQLRAEAQKEFNAYIRARDHGLPCISCGRRHEGQWHAGHFLTTAAHPELRYEPKNCHLQCQPCNTHLSGNIVEYRKGLIARYGPALVEWLEGPHEPKHYSRDDLVVEKLKWRKLARMLRDANEAVVVAREINFSLV